MTSYTLSPVWGAGAQLFDNSGNVLTGGKIYTYQAGTTTPAVTYTTPTGSAFNSNPIIANASGRLANEIWLPVSGSYKFVLKDANDVLIATYDNIPTIPQPPIVNDASSISYEQGYTVTAGAFTVGATYLIASVGTTNFVAIGAATNADGVLFTATGVGSGTGTAKYSRTVQSKLQEQVSVLDFGADPTGTTDCTVAFNAAIQAAYTVYIPDGTYLVSGVITLGENRNGNIKLIGQSTQHTVIKLTTSTAKLRCNTGTFHAWVVINNLTVDGNSVATNGIVLGNTASSTINGSVDFLDGVTVTGCTGNGFVFYGLQYCEFNNLIATYNGGSGIYVYACGNLVFNGGLLNNNSIGIWLGGDGVGYSSCSDIAINDMAQFNNTNQYIFIYSGFNIYINRNVFENEFAVAAGLININTNGLYATSNIWLDGCQFIGLPYNNHLIIVGYGNIPNITFNQCRAIYPNAGYLIVNNYSNYPVMINDCYAGVSYSDFAPSYWNGWISGLSNQKRTQDNLIQQNFTNNSVGFNTAPDYQYDFGTPSTAPSGTYTIARLYGPNWNGGNPNYTADSFQFTSSSSTIGTNRGARFDMNNLVFAFGGAAYSSGSYSWSTDVPVRVNGNFMPYTDNTFSCGTGALRWSVVYAATGTINTSDANQKTDIVDISDVEKRVAVKLKSSMKRFKFKDGKRYHFGTIAQDVKAAFEAEGLVAEEYGVFCSDELEDGSIQLGIRYDELLAFIISVL